MARSTLLGLVTLLLLGWTACLPLEDDGQMPTQLNVQRLIVLDMARSTLLGLVTLLLLGWTACLPLEDDGQMPTQLNVQRLIVLDMARSTLLGLVTLLLLGWTACLPLEDDGDSVVVEVDNNVPTDYVAQEKEIHEYFRHISSLMEGASGEPSVETGLRVAEYNPDSDVNPEELGEYLEGDIFFPDAVARNGLVLESTRWYNGEVPYEIDNSFSPSDLNKIEEAFNQYHSKTCLRFVPRQGHKDYILLTKDNTGCWSSVGRVGGRQKVNLQSPGCTYKVGTIIHELMHAVGFMHEQNRDDRDAYVSIQWQNLENGRENNFQAAPVGTTTAFGVVYDYGSVMHYTPDAFSKNGQPTIVSKVGGVSFGQREGFSNGDIQKIRAMYKCVPNCCG